MSFIDKVSIKITAGDGGNGKLSFRREKYVSKGGPDGGDGGKGGDIVFRASNNQNTLSRFRYKKELQADNGQDGGSQKKHGKNGSDLIIDIPVGTVISSGDKILADFTVNHQSQVIAAGGPGGYGNAHFVSSTRQAPNFAEVGEPGQELDVDLELKIIADVAVIGLPNAGKSTLLARVSNAKPEIGDYPFTTLQPNLGVVDIDIDHSLLLADIPGLIEGASEGKGLGHDFLRHIERTYMLLHLIDGYSDNIAGDYQIIRHELKNYSDKLYARKEVIAINKTEGFTKTDEKIIADKLSEVTKSEIIFISAMSGKGLDKLLYLLNSARDQAEASSEEVEAEINDQIPVITLKANSSEFVIEHPSKNLFIVRGEKIEKFARRTNYDSSDAVIRLKDIMKKQGVLQELKRSGIEPDQKIQIGDDSRYTIQY